ncbi:MAG: DUF3365 domain-containing protein [Candidatus Eisenbacteria bacterium]
MTRLDEAGLSESGPRPVRDAANQRYRLPLWRHLGLVGLVGLAGLTGVVIGGGAGCSGSRPEVDASSGEAVARSGQASRVADSGGARQATDAEQARAQAHIGPLKKALMGGLSGAMTEGGPTQAIEVCRTLAPQVAAELSQDGVEIGRTSHKLRNPENAPRDWVEPILDQYLSSQGESHPQWVELSSDRVGYVEPIGTMGLCLQCHGGEIAPEVREAIAQNYPGDQAVGFAAGDLRGVFWLEMPRLANE